MSSRYDLILFDKYGPENFWLPKSERYREMCPVYNYEEWGVRKFPKLVRKGPEWKNALAAKRKEIIIRLQIDGVIANYVARRILHFAQRPFRLGIYCVCVFIVCDCFYRVSKKRLIECCLNPGAHAKSPVAGTPCARKKCFLVVLILNRSISCNQRLSKTRLPRLFASTFAITTVSSTDNIC